MDVSEKTLDRIIKGKYKECFEAIQSHYRAYGKASLLRTQFKLAERNPTMAIWLGKQYLDQTDPSAKRSPGDTPKGMSRLEKFLDEAEKL